MGHIAFGATARSPFWMRLLPSIAGTMVFAAGVAIATPVAAQSYPTKPAEFGEFIREDMAKWAQVVKISGARLE